MAACGGLRPTLIADLEGLSRIPPTVARRRVDRRYACHLAMETRLAFVEEMGKKGA
jgi:hypothetical protein